jgi:hypothetical protein
VLGLPKARIFISSGQKNELEGLTSEKAIVSEIKQMLERDFDFEVYVATEKHTIEGFTENILRNLEKSEYFLFVDFSRESIDPTENIRRGSLFSHQELAIAVYLRKQLLVFQENSVKREGILSFIQANPIQILDRSKLVEQIKSNIKIEGWKSGWRNELEMMRIQDEYVDAPYREATRRVRFFHISVKNKHDTKTAHDREVYLQKIVNLETGDSIVPPMIELKWENMKTESVTILPDQERRFDAILIDHFSDPQIHLGFNTFLIDYENQIMKYKLQERGRYELEFGLISREFSPVKKKFYLDYQSSLNDITLKAVE